MQESNKFGVVKKVLVDFIKQRKTDKLALSIFADFAYTAVPLTYDKKSIIEILSHIDVGIAVLRCLIKSTKIFLTTPNLLLSCIDPEASKINEIS
jgi:Ca-activated chloride channel family protein